MSNRGLKSILFAIAVSGGGYILYKIVTPTEETSRKRMGKPQISNKDAHAVTMEQLRIYAESQDKKS